METTSPDRIERSVVTQAPVLSILAICRSIIAAAQVEQGLRTGSAHQDICNDRNGIGSRQLRQTQCQFSGWTMAHNCDSSADLGVRKGELRVAFVRLAATLVQIQAWRANLLYSAAYFLIRMMAPWSASSMKNSLGES